MNKLSLSAAIGGAFVYAVKQHYLYDSWFAGSLDIGMTTCEAEQKVWDCIAGIVELVCKEHEYMITDAGSRQEFIDMVGYYISSRGVYEIPTENEYEYIIKKAGRAA